jgi:predicted glycoside hydrolase/deacetylase ChbG (UPF0249 family)
MRVAMLAALLIGTPVGGQDVPSWAREPDVQAERVRIIIRGDDFGTTQTSNVAMQRGFEAGVMTSASVLASGPWLSEAVTMVQAHPEWSIGLHLTASSEWDRVRWGPVAEAPQVPSLVAADGNLYHSYPDSPLALQYLGDEGPYLYPNDPGQMPEETRALRRSLTASEFPIVSELEVELRAQVTRAQNLGLRIDYIDCHMGIACKPSLVPVLINLAAELCVPIPEQGWMGTKEFGFRHVGLDLATSAENFAQELGELAPGLYRLVVHPRLDQEDARAEDSYFGPTVAELGQLELDVLTSPTVRAALVRHSIELVSIRDLWDYQACQLRDS